MSDDDPEGDRRAPAHVLAALAGAPWFITRDAFSTIVSLAQRANTHPEAVQLRAGRPLEYTERVTMRDGVAIIPITGPVFRRANLFTEMSGATSVATLALDLQTALDATAVNAIVLDIDSPGGQATGIAELAAAIRAGAERKPIVAYVGGLGASAGYWLAAAATAIVVAETGVLGSIGVVQSVYTGGDKNIIEIVSSQSPKKRVDVNTPDGRATVQAFVDEYAAIFIEHVAKLRDVSVETVLADFGQGDVLLGARAVQAGMADRLGTLEDTIAGLAGASERRVTMTATKKDAPTLTREQLVADNPDLVEAIRKEGYDAGHSAGLTEGRNAGAIAERERILAVEAQLIPGHEALIATLKADGKTSGPEAAVQILAAEKAVRAGAAKDRQADAAALANKAPAAAPPATAAAAAAKDETLEARCKREWEAGVDVCTDFRSVEAYTAYVKAQADGKVA